MDPCIGYTQPTKAVRISVISAVLPAGLYSFPMSAPPDVGFRAGPAALRRAAGRGHPSAQPPISAIWTRSIATSTEIRQPGSEFLPSIAPVSELPKSDVKDRRAAIKNAKPFSDFLTDTFNRQHDYLRISITERCNLRCLYCMPEEGVPLSPPAHLLTTPEIFYLSSLFVSQGVTKIRLTGGEPTVRRDIVPLMQQIGSLRPKGLRELALTTNGISLHRKLDAMVEAGLTGINLSLDTLDPFQFQIMTRRKGFDAVMKSIDRILEMNKLGANVKLKVNCVVMRGLNEREILPFVELGREKDIEVRFIEYMPFGGNKWSENKMISFQEMLDIIRVKYPGLRPVPGHKNDTSKTYEVPGFVGKVGFITSMTNDFCGTCNRLRITSDGNLKVCLHGNAEVSLRDVLRHGNNGEPIDQEAFERIKQIEMDRHEGRLSDETILGWGQRERELLEVVGAAVKRKAEKHADLNDLANMENRPMILIDGKPLKGVGSWRLSSSRTRPITVGRSHTFSSATGMAHASMSHLYSPATLRTNTIRAFASLSPPEKRQMKVSKLPGGNDWETIRLLKLVALYGPDRASMPQYLEVVRQKYDMVGPEYEEYWKLVAQAKLLEGKGKAFKHASRKANARLASWIRGKQDIKHRNLMREVQSLRDRMRLAAKTAAEHGEQEVEVEGEDGKTLPQQDVAAQIENAKIPTQQPDAFNLTTFLEELRIPSDSERMLKKTEEEIHRLQDRITRHRQRKPSATESQAQRLSESPTTSADDVPVNSNRTTDEELRGDEKTGTHADQQWEKVHGISQLLEKYKQQFEETREQARKREVIRKRKEEVLVRKRILLKELWELEEKEREAKRVPKPTDTNTQRDESAPNSLDAILNEAVKKVNKHLGEPKSTRRSMEAVSARATSQAKEDMTTKLRKAGVSSVSVLAQSKPADGVRETKSEKAKLDVSPPQTPSDSLHLRVPPSGFVPIDENLIVTFEGSVPELQSQVFTMAERLKSSYPRIDTLPYDIWTSQNKATLQTWLKILVKKWQTRFDSIEQTGQVERDIVDGRVQMVLDRMVGDHDLSNEAAERMAMRWHQVFEQRGAMHGDAEGVLDRDEFHAEGLGFLADEPEPELPVQQQQAETTSSAVILSSTHKRPTMYQDSQSGVLHEPVARKMYSTSSRSPPATSDLPSQQKTNTAAKESPEPSLPHLTSTGSAHMVSVSAKQHTIRTAIAVGSVHFTNSTPLSLIHSNSAKKGDVLGVSRIAGIMAAKKCPDLIPLCHPIPLTHVSVELKPFSGATESSSSPKEDGLKEEKESYGGVKIEAKVQCTGPTGVEMEALTAVMGAALSVVDMCKAVDRFQVVKDVRVVFKEGGKSGVWREEGWKSWQE
ncbi:Molybdenum cofactor biosynthesis protein [Curvularia clavata]|uniref:Molybdenum cofactor biosynthesis protein n=1 Tax=Curvularia clavata TaxID=95742 RepID=A0A9Q8ZCJ6_CURCL|nr:Molybdenum cofactor biosynthesis protein [Curvularia clavata]